MINTTAAMLSSSSSAPSPPSSPLASLPPPSLLAARSLQARQDLHTAPPATTVAPSAAGSGPAWPWFNREANSHKPPSPKPLASSSFVPSPLLVAGSKPDLPILIESDEIPSLDDILKQSECQPDPMYLYQSLKDKRYVCVGPEPSPFCITHRR